MNLAHEPQRVALTRVEKNVQSHRTWFAAQLDILRWITMKYDDASWHYGGEFPDELDEVAGATHIGMFVAWALLSDLGGKLHTEEFVDELAKLRDRNLTPGQYFIACCGEKFSDEDLNGEGNDFALAYFDHENGAYLDDYEEILGNDFPTLYHVADTWENFDKLKPVIDAQYSEWKNSR